MHLSYPWLERVQEGCAPIISLVRRGAGGGVHLLYPWLDELQDGCATIISLVIRGAGGLCTHHILVRRGGRGIPFSMQNTSIPNN